MAQPWEETSFSEEAINDIQTARLALRWALDRIHALQDEIIKFEQTVQDKSSQVAFLDNQLKLRSADLAKMLHEREEEIRSEKENLERLLQGRIDTYKRKEEELDLRRRDLEEEYQKKSEEMRTQWSKIEMDLWKSRQEYLQRQDEFLQQQQGVFLQKEKRLREELENYKILLQKEHQSKLLEVERRHQLLQEELKKEEAVFRWARASWEKEVETKEKEWRGREVSFQNKILELEAELKSARGEIQNLEQKVQALSEGLAKKMEETESLRIQILELNNERQTLREKTESLQEEHERMLRETEQKVGRIESDIPSRLKTAQEQGRFEAEKKFEEKAEEFRSQLVQKEEEIGNLDNVIKSLEGMVKVLEGEKQNLLEHSEKVKKDFDRKTERLEEEKRILEEKTSQRLSTAVENEVRQMQEEFDLKKRTVEASLRLREEEVRHLKEMTATLEEERRNWLAKEQALREDLRKSQEASLRKSEELEATSRAILEAEKHKFREILKSRDEQIDELRTLIQNIETGHLKGSRPLPMGVAPIAKEPAAKKEECPKTPDGLADLEKPLALNLQSVQIGEVVDAAVERVGARCRAQGVAVSKNFAPGLKSIQADPGLLKEALSQVVTNAIDAMPDGGKLMFEVRRDPIKDQVVIRVQDTGTGITREHMDRLFEPFFSNKPAGLGLGLTVARRILRAHKGDVLIQSEYKKGTTVTFILPS
ncbi:MAG: hypothetical protein HY400_01285 [Elusimicrobia bacterium]|nr:hypothetical protein [Elusimicrobiota bacterium]